MIKRRIAALALPLAAALLAGCSHAPVEPGAPKVAAASAASGPERILALNKQLVTNHRTLFSLVKNRYSYYIGGVLLAEYGPNTGILHVSSLRPDQSAVACEYDPRGDLFIAATAAADKQHHTADCDRLTQILSADLAR